MKRHSIFLFFFLFICFSMSNAQDFPDSIIFNYHNAKEHDAKVNAVVSYLNSISINDSTWLSKAFVCRNFLIKQNDEIGVDRIDYRIGWYRNRKGDYVSALRIVLPLLPKFESRNDTNGITDVLSTIGNAYTKAAKYGEAITYFKRLLSFGKAKGDDEKVAMLLNQIGLLHSYIGEIDSALAYAQKGLKVAQTTSNDSLVFYPISTIGEIYINSGDYDLALPYIRRVLSYPPWFNDDECLMSMHTNLTQIYSGMKHYDSTYYYARMVLSRSNSKKAWGRDSYLLRVYEYLYKSFDATQQPDSSNKYFRMLTTLKDSLYSQEKLHEVEVITSREQMQQLQIENERILAAETAEEERRQNVEYAAAGVGIISLIILFLLLSRSILVRPRFIKVFGIIGLLITFEFLNLLLHPFLAAVTNHSPILMLLALAGVAALLVPLHHRLEKWINTKLVEKNEKIRLAAAKRIIEESALRQAQDDNLNTNI